MKAIGTMKMQRVFSLFIYSNIFMAVVAGNVLPAISHNNEKPIYIVRLTSHPEASEQANKLTKEYGALHQYRHVFKGFAAELSPAALTALQNNPNVEEVEQAFTVFASAETYPTGVDRVDADLVHSTWGGTGARVAIVDTGIDTNHPDLDGRVNTALSRTFVSRGRTTENGLDDHGHGTHVAGTVAATLGNGIGVVGVSPQAELIALKVLNRNGSGSTADIIAALDYITGYNNSRNNYADLIHVANFSLGGTGSDSDSSFRRAFEGAVASGCFITAAAGNESDNAANHVPAAYDSVFTVSAMDPRNDTFATFSNFGADVDIAAPGVAINSTMLGGGYASWNGTSMATPHVSGAAALYVGQDIIQNLGGLTKATAPASIRTALLISGEAIVFSGDPDGLHEPLLDAEALLGPIAPPADAIKINVDSDKPSYSDTDNSASLFVQVNDETGNPVAELTTDNFHISGTSFTFINQGAGTYALTIDISGLSNNVDYPFVVTATDGLLEDSATVVIRKATAKTIYISKIIYEKIFKNLRGYLTVSDLDMNPVANATIDLTLNRDGAAYKNFSITTADNGIADFRVGNARRGDYTITINNVTFPGPALYVPELNVTDPGFTVQ